LHVAKTIIPMRRLIVLGLLLLLLPRGAHAQTEAGLRIAAPASGDVLRGLVNVNGTSAVDGFFASELAFAYASDPTDTWFIISTSDQAVTDGLIGAWDTNAITDGDYNLRLRVTLQDATTLETIVTGLRIRNQTPTETPTPAPTSTPEFVRASDVTPLPTGQPVPTSTRRPAPTPLPPNPAAVTPSEINLYLTRGLFITFVAFLLVGLLLRLRR
jgi:hypothetical protein